MGVNNILGLPFSNDGKMQKIAICFDVDGTLITHQGNERHHITGLLEDMRNAFKNSKIVIWSGGGADYAEERARELGINHLAWKILSKTDYKLLRKLGYTILAIDDVHDTRIGDINLIVKQ